MLCNIQCEDVGNTESISYFLRLNIAFVWQYKKYFVFPQIEYRICMVVVIALVAGWYLLGLTMGGKGGN